jgi:hypothetical protein
MVTRKTRNRNTTTDKRVFEKGEVQTLKMTGKINCMDGGSKVSDFRNDSLRVKLLAPEFYI